MGSEKPGLGQDDEPEPCSYKNNYYLSPSSEAIYQSLIKEAPYIPGDNGENCEIPWADPKLIKEGQDFVRDNQLAVSLAHISALLFGFSFKSLTGVLLRTGGYGLGDVKKSMERTFETGIHLRKWYESNILESLGDGYKDVQVVRKLHWHALHKSERTPVVLCDEVPNMEEKEGIINALKMDLDECVDTRDSPKELFTYDPKVFMSQYDMVMTQFGFIGLIFLFPSALGIRDTRGIPGFLHLWAVIGKMLGIEDRFNLALNPDRNLCLKLFYKLGMACLKEMDLTMLHLQQTFIDALEPTLKIISLKSSLYVGLINEEALPNFKGNHLYSILSWKEWAQAKYVQLVFYILYHSDFLRTLINSAYKSRMERIERKFFANKKKSLAEKSLGVASPSPSSFPIHNLGKRIWKFIQTALTVLQKT